MWDKIDVEMDKIAIVRDDGPGLTGAYKYVNQADISKYEREAKELVERANQLRKQGKKVSYVDFTPEENARMKLYNATMRLNRLEYLKSQIGLSMVKTGINVDSDLRSKLTDDYIKEKERQAGILADSLQGTAWTSSEVAQAVMAQTGSANFSQRLWADNDALKAELDAVISSDIVRGSNPREMARLLKDHVKSTVTNHRYITERLARTESARVQAEAQINSFIKNDYRFCVWITEPKACSTCKEIEHHDSGNGAGVYEVAKVPSLPAHPNCRCSLSATWVDGKNNSYKDTFGGSDETEPRKVKKHKVPSGKVDANEQPEQAEEIHNYVNDDLVAAFNKALGVKQAKKTVSEINETLSKAPGSMKKMFAKYQDNFKMKFTRNDSYYSLSDKTVRLDKKSLNVGSDMEYYQKKNDVFFHEFGHLIDNQSTVGRYDISSNLLMELNEDIDNIIETMINRETIKVTKVSEADKMGYVENYGWFKVKKNGELTVQAENKLYKMQKSNAFRTMAKEIKDAGHIKQDYGDVSDMISGTGIYQTGSSLKSPLGIGHKWSYFNQSRGRFLNELRCAEFFAEATSATINNPGSLELIKKYFPNAYAKYEKLVEKVIADE